MTVFNTGVEHKLLAENNTYVFLFHCVSDTICMLFMKNVNTLFIKHLYLVKSLLGPNIMFHVPLPKDFVLSSPAGKGYQRCMGI